VTRRRVTKRRPPARENAPAAYHSPEALGLIVGIDLALALGGGGVAHLVPVGEEGPFGDLNTSGYQKPMMAEEANNIGLRNLDAGGDLALGQPLGLVTGEQAGAALVGLDSGFGKDLRNCPRAISKNRPKAALGERFGG
jgi:hypothetical protein